MEITRTSGSFCSTAARKDRQESERGMSMPTPTAEKATLLARICSGGSTTKQVYKRKAKKARPRLPWVGRCPFVTTARLPRDILPSSGQRRAAGGRPQADEAPLTVTPSQVTAPVQLEALAVAVRGTDGQPVARLEVGSAGGAAPRQGLRLVHFLALPAALGRRGRTHLSR